VIAHAIDRQIVLNVGWFGCGTIVSSPIGPSLARYTAHDVHLYETKARTAEVLLDEAGFPRGADGVRFALTIDSLPSSESFRKVADYLRQALGKIGIAVTIRAQEFAAYVKRVYRVCQTGLHGPIQTVSRGPWQRPICRHDARKRAPSGRRSQWQIPQPPATKAANGRLGRSYVAAIRRVAPSTATTRGGSRTGR
jgi:ABC-type transport system substrate-binding protein